MASIFVENVLAVVQNIPSDTLRGSWQGVQILVLTYQDNFGCVSNLFNQHVEKFSKGFQKSI